MQPAAAPSERSRLSIRERPHSVTRPVTSGLKGPAHSDDEAETALGDAFHARRGVLLPPPRAAVSRSASEQLQDAKQDPADRRALRPAVSARGRIALSSLGLNPSGGRISMRVDEQGPAFVSMAG